MTKANNIPSEPGRSGSTLGDTGDPMRIAAILVGLRPDGGAEALLRTFADYVGNTDHELHVICLSDLGPEVRATLTAAGLGFTELPARRLIDPGRFVRLVKALRGFDVVQTNLLSPNVLGVLAARALGIGSVAILHNEKSYGDSHLYHGKAEGLTLGKLADRVVAVGPRTQIARQEFLPGVEIHVLPNAVAPGPRPTDDERRALRAEVMTDPDGYMLLNVGRLHPQKAQDALIDSLPSVLERIPNAELVVVGSGDLHEPLAKQAADLGLTDRVNLTGARTDARELMAACDMFVLPSSWEGLPVAMLEAMEAGVPVLASAVGDVSSVLGDDAGWTLPGNTPEAIAAGIIEVYQAPDIADRVAEAQARVAQDFNADRWAEEMLNHLRAAMSQHR